jgi:hypothetical protein
MMRNNVFKRVKEKYSRIFGTRGIKVKQEHTLEEYDGGSKYVYLLTDRIGRKFVCETSESNSRFSCAVNLLRRIDDNQDN